MTNWDPEDWTKDDQREWEAKERQKEIERFEDKIRLSPDLIKEKWKRSIYVKWVTEMFKRKKEGSCPRCGIRHWVQRGSGFRKKWMCDECGLKVSKKDLYKAQIYFDFITLHARKEVKRIAKRRRQSQSVKTYESDKI